MVLAAQHVPKVSKEVAEQLGLHDLRFKGQYHVQAASAANGGATLALILHEREGSTLQASKYCTSSEGVLVNACTPVCFDEDK